MGQSCIPFTVLKGSKAIDHHPPGILVIGVNLGMDGRDMSLIIFQLFQKAHIILKQTKPSRLKFEARAEVPKTAVT